MTTRDRAVEAAEKAIDAAHQNPKLDAEVVVCDAIVAVLAAEVRAVHKPIDCSPWWCDCAGHTFCRSCDSEWPCATELTVRGWEG